MKWNKKVLADLWVILVIGGFLGFLAPFGMDTLAIERRVFFWVLACLTGYLIYKPCIHFAQTKLENRIPKYSHRVVIGTILASIPATFALLATNQLFFDEQILTWNKFVKMFPKVLLIGAAVSAISILKSLAEERKDAFERSNQDNQILQAKLKSDPFEYINNQLPMAKRGELLSIETADHYLNVTTDKGSHLVLMRFKDALKHLEHAPGLQVHRSWWVAIDAIENVQKDNRKVSLRLKNQITVPVSKTYLAALKALEIK